MAVSSVSQVSKPNPRPEHPQPQKYRPDWVSLNGEWEFSFDHARTGMEEKWFESRTFSRKILVPFTHQWKLSGIEDRAIEDVVWYSRTFEIPREWLTDKREVLLHFGAVDYSSTVWINGKQVTTNRGGNVPFSCSIAHELKPGENRVTLLVEDSLDPYQPRGKQATNGVARSCDYHGTTGIWQSVWLESVNSVRVQDFVFKTKLGTPDHLQAEVFLHAPPVDLGVGLEISFEGARVAFATASAKNGIAYFDIPVADAHRWSPDNPALYDVTLTLTRDHAEIDRVQTYFGFREISVSGDRFFLNGELLYMKLVLDQGYWPDSGLTAPSDDALREDVEWTKRLGFNGARKHQKVEDPRWLYWCDKLGLLVWGEMANARAWSAVAERMLTDEWERAIRRDLNHPCIIAWVPFNESWGLPLIKHGHAGQLSYLERITHLTRRLDGTRLIVDNDGWDHSDNCDIFAIHDYTPKGEDLKARYLPSLSGGPMISLGWGKHPTNYWVPGAQYAGQPVVLSEIGGFLSAPKDVPLENLDPLFGIYGFQSHDERLETKYDDLLTAIGDISFVSGFCYTQLTDVEQEVNGLLTYDRKPKVDPDVIRAIHERVEAAYKNNPVQRKEA